MTFTVGGVNVTAVHVGPAAADAVYLGADKVWPTGGGPPSALFNLILSYNPSIYLPLNNGDADDASPNAVTTTPGSTFPTLNAAPLLSGDTYSSDWVGDNDRGIVFTLGGSDFPGPHTAICFVNVDDLTDNRTMWCPRASQPQAWQFQTSGVPRLISELPTWSAITAANTPIVTGATHMLTYRCAGGGNWDDPEFLLDGLTDGGGTQSPLRLGSADEMTIGKRWHTTAAYTDAFSGRLAHFALFPSYLDDTAIQAIFAASGL